MIRACKTHKIYILRLWMYFFYNSFFHRAFFILLFSFVYPYFSVIEAYIKRNKNSVKKEVVLLHIIDYVDNKIKIIVHYSSNESTQRYIYSRRGSARKRGFGGPPWFICSPRENKQKRQTVLASTWQTTARYIRAIPFSRGRPQQIQIHRVPKRTDLSADLSIDCRSRCNFSRSRSATCRRLFAKFSIKASYKGALVALRLLHWNIDISIYFGTEKRGWLMIMPL